MNVPSKTHKLALFTSLFIFIELLGVLIAFVFIPADPKNSFLLGFSKSRFALILFSFFLIALFFALFKKYIYRFDDFQKGIKWFENKYHKIAKTLLLILSIILLLISFFYSIGFFENEAKLFTKAFIYRLSPILILGGLISLKGVFWIIKIAQGKHPGKFQLLEIIKTQNKAFSTKLNLTLQIIGGSLLIINLLTFATTLYFKSESVLVQYIPDDSFYYLTLAKNFVSQNNWSFDSGYTVTSGFHLFWAYILSFVFQLINPTNSQFVRLGFIFSSLISLVTIIIALSFSKKLKTTYFIYSLLLLASSKIFLLNSISILEWPLTILFATLYIIHIWNNSTYDQQKKPYLIIFLLGFLGSLARSDFGLLPFSVFIVSLLFLYKKYKPYLLLSFIGFLGAGFGLLFSFLHNFYYTGDFLQSSARVKAYWATFFPYSFTGTLDIIRQVTSFGNLPNKLFLWLLISVFFTTIFLGWKFYQKTNTIKKTQNQLYFILPIASYLCLLGYILLYSRNGALQIWYSVNFIVPLLIIIFSFVSVIEFYLGRKNTTVGFSIIVIIAFLTNINTTYPIMSNNSPWPHQQYMLSAGNYLATFESDRLIGSWNAGIIGYFQGGQIINLDGLVNNEIFPYIINNKVPEYINIKNIRYVIDFEKMFTRPLSREKGGYANEIFINQLTPIKIFDNSSFSWKHLTLFEFNP